MENKEIPQKINISMNQAFCTGCGRNILDISNIRFIRNAFSDAISQEELYVCRECGTEFLLRYDILDAEGHIQQRIFTDDPNDPKYNWPDILTPEQKVTVAEHLKTCKICNKRLEEEFETNLWFSTLIHNKH
jgi:uncharacterized protein with PIN domain